MHNSSVAAALHQAAHQEPSVLRFSLLLTCEKNVRLTAIQVSWCVLSAFSLCASADAVIAAL